MAYPVRPVAERLIKKISIDQATGCWNWTGAKFRNGYGAIQVNGFCKKAHRVSYSTFVGEIPDGFYVCHSCDNPPCVNPSHLFVGTAKDNAIDMQAKGRKAITTGRAKLTNEGVLLIRAQFGLGKKQHDVAKEFGISQATVSLIWKRKIWKLL
jgi:hypothetical protein